MKHILSILFVALGLSVSAQNQVSIKINHLINGNSFQMGTEGTNNLDQAFKLRRLQYYISSITVVHDNGTETARSDVYALVDASGETSIDLGSMDVTDVEAIRFSVGVNSPENNQDPTQWPADHALYPKSPSMHWGWTAGYRFVALEGSAGFSFNRNVEIHALGNENYHKISIPVAVTASDGAAVVELNADYAMALENISIVNGLVNHGTTIEAAELLRNFRDHVFTSTSGEGNTLNVEKISDGALVSMYPNPSADGAFVLETDLTHPIASVRILDATGAVVLTDETVLSGTDFRVAQAGIYFVEILFDDQSKIVKKFIRL